MIREKKAPVQKKPINVKLKNRFKIRKDSYSDKRPQRVNLKLQMVTFSVLFVGCIR